MDCSPLFVGSNDVLTGGRATVFDAPLVSTAREQCKNGGYALFQFGSQGQCIAFVDQQHGERSGDGSAPASTNGGIPS